MFLYEQHTSTIVIVRVYNTFEQEFLEQLAFVSVYKMQWSGHQQALSNDTYLWTTSEVICVDSSN